MAIFTAIGAAIFGVGTFLAGATAFVLQTAAGIGLNLLAQKIAGKKQPQQQQSTGPGFSVQGTLSSGGDIPRSFVIGWGMTAGSLVYANTWGSDGQTPNAYMVQVIACSDLPVDSFAGVWVNGEFVTLDETPHSDFGHPVLEYRVGGKDHLWVKFYTGTQTTADPYLVSKFFADPNRPYEPTRVGTGIAYAICTSLVNDTLFTGFPSFKFELNGVKLYDPSKDSSVGGDGSQRWDTPSTWGGDGDHLPAVQIYNILRGITFDGEWFYGLQGMSEARLPVSNWIAQIEKCRAQVEAPDGSPATEPRYRSGGEIVVGNQIGDTIEELLLACQGKVSEIGGFYKIHLGEPDSPVFSFTDDDIITHEEQSFYPFFGLADTVNGFTAKYPAPDEAWNMKPAPPIYRSDLEVQAGNRRLLADVALNFVPYKRQVQDLMKSALAEAQRARRHTFTLPPKFWIYEPGDIGEWTSKRNGYETKRFRVDGVLDQPNLDVMFDLTEIDPSDYDFDINADYTPPTEGPTQIVRPPAQPIVDWTVTGSAVRDALGLPRRPALLLEWDGEQDDIEAVEFEVRLQSSGEVIHRGRTENYAAGSILTSQGLVGNTTYEARGRYIPRSARETTFSSWLAATTPDIDVGLEDFSEGLRDYIENQLAPYRNGFDAIAQKIAWMAAAQDAANYYNLYENRVLVDTRVGDVEVTIEETAQVVGLIDGRLAATWQLTIDNNGYINGIQLYNDGQQADFAIVADKLIFNTPTGDYPMFLIQDGQAILNGELFAEKITTGMLSAGVIEAIQADIQIVNSDQINAGIITVDKIDSNAAIYNFGQGLATGQIITASLNKPQSQPTVSGTFLLQDVAYTSVTPLLWAIGAGAFDVNPGTVQTAAGLTENCSVTFVMTVETPAGSILRSFPLASAAASTTTGTGFVQWSGLSQLRHQNYSLFSLPTGTDLRLRIRASIVWTTTGAVGPSTRTATWRFSEASVLALEPRGAQ